MPADCKSVNFTTVLAIMIVKVQLSIVVCSAKYSQLQFETGKEGLHYFMPFSWIESIYFPLTLYQIHWFPTAGIKFVRTFKTCWLCLSGPAVDECSMGLHDCDVGAFCTDTRYYFKCQCYPGYIQTGMARTGECKGITWSSILNMKWNTIH